MLSEVRPSSAKEDESKHPDGASFAIQFQGVLLMLVGENALARHLLSNIPGILRLASVAFAPAASLRMTGVGSE